MNSPELIQLEGFTLAGILFEANLEETAAKGLLPQAYHELMQWKAQWPEDARSIYLLQEYPETPGFDPFQHPFRQLVAFRIPAAAVVPQGLHIYEVPPTRYVYFRYEGNDEGLSAAYAFLYREWIPANNLCPLCYDFEYWGTSYTPDDPESVYELHIPVV